MKNITSAIFAFCAICLLLTGSATAATTQDIQMLPPLGFDNATTCGTAVGAGTGMLYWDGLHPIHCIPGFTGDADGNINVQGTTTIGGRLFTGLDGGNNFWLGPPNLDSSPFPHAFGYHYNGTVVDTVVLGGSVVQVDNKLAFGTSTPNSSLDLSLKTDAVSMPSGTAAERPTSLTEGMTRYNTEMHKLEYWNGTVWVPIATSQPQITTVTAPWVSPDGPYGFPFELVTHYLDCPEGSIAVGCVSISSGSGQYVCDTYSGTDPNTGLSACVQAGCNAHASGDKGYYTSVSCIKF